jgi:hypothetical protein
VLTGAAELDAALAAFDLKVQRKVVVKALRNAIKFVANKFKSLVPFETGAMRDAAFVRKPRGTKRGEIKLGLFVSRDKLFKLRKKRGAAIGQTVISIGDARRGSIAFGLAKLLGVRAD